MPRLAGAGSVYLGNSELTHIMSYSVPVTWVVASDNFDGLKSCLDPDASSLLSTACVQSTWDCSWPRMPWFH